MTVPYELVHELINSALNTIEEWHKENEFKFDLEICCAAVLLMSKCITEDWMSMPKEGGTLQ